MLAGAAARCLDAGADLVDINMACPVRKVMKTGAGAALLAEPDRAAGIVRAMVDACRGARVPVTVKIRSGLREGDEAGRRLAPRLVAAGAAAVCIHPRTAAQLYRGRADHDVTAALAADLPVPVIASGDVDGRAAALRAARPRRRRRDARPPCRRRALALPRVLAGAPPPGPDERLKEVRLFADQVLQEMGAARGRPPAPVLAALPARRRARQAAGAAAHGGAGRGRLVALLGLPEARPMTRIARARARCRILARHFGTRLPRGRVAALKRRHLLIDREIILTPEGYQRLKEEIEYLSSVKRDEVADRIRASRDFGDISENSEYDDAKNEQAMLEARIYALEEKIRSAIVIDADASRPTRWAWAPRSRCRT